MKKLITTILLLGIFCGLVEAEKNKNPLMAADTIVWAGLDYSMLHIIGRTNDIKVPDLIFQDMPRKWNDLFLDERIEGVANSLNKRALIDIGGVTERNATLSANKNIFEFDAANALEKSYITQKEIADAVFSYKMENTNGLALVFIVDSMIYYHGVSSYKPSFAEGVTIVFFDITTREIISSKHEIKLVTFGGSFRNLWFGLIKDLDLSL